jgi:aryl-alcohol dehydrogenase (NADP+)
LLSKPGISAPIIGASRLSHLDDALKALEIRLGEAEIDQLEELYRPHPVVGFR